MSGTIKNLTRWSLVNQVEESAQTSHLSEWTRHALVPVLSDKLDVLLASSYVSAR